MKILVSSCLLGCPVRYDGRDKLSPAVAALAQEHELVPVCPEAECGMGVPREPMSLAGGRLVSNLHGHDLTPLMASWIERALARLEADKPELAILKSKSPSCGRNGLFRLALEKRFPGCRVLDETETGEFPASSISSTK